MCALQLGLVATEARQVLKAGPASSACSLAALSRLPVCTAILHETLRLYPPVQAIHRVLQVPLLTFICIYFLLASTNSIVNFSLHIKQLKIKYGAEIYHLMFIDML